MFHSPTRAGPTAPARRSGRSPRRPSRLGAAAPGAPHIICPPHGEQGCPWPQRAGRVRASGHSNSLSAQAEGPHCPDPPCTIPALPGAHRRPFPTALGPTATSRGWRGQGGPSSRHKAQKGQKPWRLAPHTGIRTAPPLFPGHRTRDGPQGCKHSGQRGLSPPVLTAARGHTGHPLSPEPCHPKTGQTRGPPPGSECCPPRTPPSPVALTGLCQLQGPHTQPKRETGHASSRCPHSGPAVPTGAEEKGPCPAPSTRPAPATSSLGHRPSLPVGLCRPGSA